MTTDGIGDLRVRVLVFGFSVTAGSGGDNYGVRLKELLQERGEEVEVDVVGVGGVDALFAAFTIEEKLKAQKYDYVVLEILARGGRASSLWTDLDKFLEAYRTVLAKVIDAGAFPIVLELYRHGVDPNVDPIWPAVQEINTNCGVKSLDYSSPVRQLSKESRAKLFRDGVHTTPEGSQYYADALAEFFTSDLLQEAKVENPRQGLQPTIHGTVLAGLLPHMKPPLFQRGGYAVDCIIVNEGSSVTLRFPEVKRFVAITSIIGPLSGDFLVGTPDNPNMHTIIGYDEYSYYGRIACSLFSPIESDVIVLTQLAGVPDRKLIKGEVNLGPRQGKFAHLVWVTPPTVF